MNASTQSRCRTGLAKPDLCPKPPVYRNPRPLLPNSFLYQKNRLIENGWMLYQCYTTKKTWLIEEFNDEITKTLSQSPLACKCPAPFTLALLFFHVFSLREIENSTAKHSQQQCQKSPYKARFSEF